MRGQRREEYASASDIKNFKRFSPGIVLLVFILIKNTV